MSKTFNKRVTLFEDDESSSEEGPITRNVREQKEFSGGLDLMHPNYILKLICETLIAKGANSDFSTYASTSINWLNSYYPELIEYTFSDDQVVKDQALDDVQFRQSMRNYYYNLKLGTLKPSEVLSLLLKDLTAQYAVGIGFVHALYDLQAIEAANSQEVEPDIVDRIVERTSDQCLVRCLSSACAKMDSSPAVLQAFPANLRRKLKSVTRSNEMSVRETRAKEFVNDLRRSNFVVDELEEVLISLYHQGRGSKRELAIQALTRFSAIYSHPEVVPMGASLFAVWKFLRQPDYISRNMPDGSSTVSSQISFKKDCTIEEMIEGIYDDLCGSRKILIDVNLIPGTIVQHEESNKNLTKLTVLYNLVCDLLNKKVSVYLLFSIKNFEVNTSALGIFPKGQLLTLNMSEGIFVQRVSTTPHKFVGKGRKKKVLLDCFFSSNYKNRIAKLTIGFQMNLLRFHLSDLDDKQDLYIDIINDYLQYTVDLEVSHVLRKRFKEKEETISLQVLELDIKDKYGFSDDEEVLLENLSSGFGEVGNDNLDGFGDFGTSSVVIPTESDLSREESETSFSGEETTAYAEAANVV